MSDPTPEATTEAATKATPTPHPIPATAWGPARISHDRFFVGTWLAVMIGALVWEASPAGGIVLCPWRSMTGYSCPGCGMTRSCTAFVHLDLWGSLQYHPLGALFVVWLTGMALWRGRELYHNRMLAWPRTPLGQRVWHAMGWGVGAYILLFGAVRLGMEIAGFLTPV